MATNPTQLHQLSLLLGPDPSHFETLLSHLMSSSNDQRSTAEFLFNLCKQTHPDSLLLRLTQLLSSSSFPENRAMSAVLLRKHLTSATDDSFLYPKLTESTRSTIKNSLLSSLQHETAKSVTRKINDTISELAAAVLPDGGWQELLPFMLQCVTAQNNHNLQESSLLIFARLAQYIGETLIPHLATLHGVFLNCLNNSTSSEVRIAALNATINFIQCLTNNSDREKFQDLLPLMMRTLTEALNGNQEATAQEALELLIELAGGEPRFLRKQIVEVVGSMLQIAEAVSLEEGTRHLAIEFVITLAEARDRAPGMMRKLPQFVHRLFMVLMGMLLDIDDDQQWHGAETEDEDAGETSNYGFGQECLDRLAIALGGNTVVPVASEVFPAFFSAPEWQKPHAALITLAQIAEGCSKVMIKNLDQVVSMVMNSFQHPHPRVRWAAINAIGQLSTDLGPDLQMKYHQLVLPALAGAMDDVQNPRVQAHAASAMLNFSENCMPDILTPYLDGVVSKLLVLLQNGKLMVKEGALTALASVADSSQEHFQKYYDAVMPYLKAILINANDKSNRMLRAKSMECISLVGMAVGKDKFRDDAKQVMDVLMSLQGSQMEADDPTTSYMLQVATILVPLLKFYFHEEVRKAAVSAMPELLGSAKLSVEKDQSRGHNESYIKQLSDYIVPALVEALHKEPEVEICVSMLDSLTECIQVSGRFLDECQVRSIVEEIKQVITASSVRKQERVETIKAEDFDTEEGELLEEENELEEELFDRGKDKTAEERRIVICIFDDVVEHCKEAALKYYDTYVPFLLEACNDGSPDVRQIVPAWLSCLPIKSDLIEAKVVHDQLCSMVERSDKELFGSNNQYLPKIVRVFAEVICAGKELATEQTGSRMINLLRQLQQMLPPATLASTWSSLEPQQQLALQSILSS
ncbi:hypothetical protein SADUNF_Sadunf13G0047300 [Salix dunnii]|uniref:Importin N-terminal domain-containing protein n=1 Tax=Salix dunnii TaxID=1413687 RepID=A0A835MLN9_9ROSI|nr:hypothetical protein SADUNF_Sadunf13G0047300 [Salix dunnii]